jgi:hypothetical protein
VRWRRELDILVRGQHTHTAGRQVFSDQFDHQIVSGRIQIREWLIHQPYTGIGYQHSCKGNPSLLARRQGSHWQFRESSQTQALENAVEIVEACASKAGFEAQILAKRQIALETHAVRQPHDIGTELLAVPVRPNALPAYVALFETGQAGYRTQETRLAAAIGALYEQKLART